jgi:hypothetical protein
MTQSGDRIARLITKREVIAAHEMALGRGERGSPSPARRLEAKPRRRRPRSPLEPGPAPAINISHDEAERRLFFASCRYKRPDLRIVRPLLPLARRRSNKSSSWRPSGK